MATEGQMRYANNTNNVGAMQIEVQSVSPGSVEQNSVSFDKASSNSFIASLSSFLWYIVPLLLIDIGEITRRNDLKQFYEDVDSWSDNDQEDYDQRMSYLIPFLISSILFTITTIIQIRMWYTKIRDDGMDNMYSKLCILNVVLSFIGCLVHAIGLANLEDDTVGNIKNLDDKDDDYKDDVTHKEMLYGGFLLMCALYNLYFSATLFPQIGENQFIRLVLSSFILIFHCIAYIPYFFNEADYWEDVADRYDDCNDSDSYSYYYYYYYSYNDCDFEDALYTFYSSFAAKYSTMGIGLIIIIIASAIIMILNIANIIGGGDNSKTISQLSSIVKKVIYICVIGIVVGLIIYLVSLSTIFSVSFFTITLLAEFYMGVYILFGALVIIFDLYFTYKSIV